ncbi:MAG TPA: SDR family oxidoreductase [Verrucomicrobiae bacterium]|nr:SDR family oxidoreductase [Verrucomicrobiae bacterium]
MNNLSGKTVLVTGGARRLGKAFVQAAAAAGAQVAFTYLNSKAEASRVLAEIEAQGEEALAVPCDVRRSESIAAAIKTVSDKFGKLDVLINNAGFYETVALEDLKEEQWDEMFAINVRGPFLVAKHCIPALRQSRGRIIHLGSLGGEKPWATHAHYCSSKAALHMLTRVMAKALAPEISVNCVAPGMIELEEGKGDPAAFKRFAAQTPMQRNGAAGDVVSAVLYLATAPKFITGQVVTVDGGLGLR